MFGPVGWIGEDCSIPQCENDCSGHGYCNASARDHPSCDCDEVGCSFGLIMLIANMMIMLIVNMIHVDKMLLCYYI